MPELTVDLSPQAIKLLQDLTRWGVYGCTVEEIAGRFVDRQLADMGERKLLKLIPKETSEPPTLKEKPAWQESSS